MTRRISIRRIVGAVVAVGLIIQAVAFALEYRRRDRSFYDWIDARPASMAVDLSRPGTVTAPFHQTCQVSHGEAFYLTVDPIGDRNKSELLRGLEGTITINDIDGKEMQSLRISAELDLEHEVDEPIQLAYFDPFEIGDYSVVIDIRNGASSLAGTKQAIHARYILCGLERFPATLALLLAFACGSFGLVLGGVVTIRFINHGLSLPNTNTSELSDAPERE